MTLAPSPLLSVEEARRSMQPLRGWSEDDQALLAGAVQTLLDQWTAAWGLASAKGAAVEIFSCPMTGGAWDGVWSVSEEAGLLWSLRGGGLAVVPVSRQQPAMEALHGALFDEAAAAGADRLADRLVQAAWLDWHTRLGGLLPAADGKLPAGSDAAALIRRRWSGVLLAVVPWCGRQMALLFTAERVAAFLGRQGNRAGAPRPVATRPVPLVSLAEVVKTEGVALRVELGEMEVDLGTLVGLRAGDVLRTAHRLDAPLLLTGQGPAGRVTQCTGHLGRQEEWRAIELLPHGARTGNGKTI